MILSMFMGPAAAEEAQKPLTAPVETEHSWGMPVEASNFAEGTDALYYFIFILDTLFFVLILAAMGYFMWKYRRRSEDQKTSSITHNGKIEFLWSAVPAVLLVVIFVWGEIDFVKQSVPPADALDIRVNGQKWFWTVKYPDYPNVTLVSSVDEPKVTMIVPKGRPVRLTMTSDDVIHSFYVPAFRIKRDAVPGRYTNIWFEATKVGDYNIFCTEYCGDWHSKMTGIIRVLPPEQFVAALEEAGRLDPKPGEDPVAFGARVYKARNCNACHSIDGTKGTGPTWTGLWGKQETFTDGSTLTVEGAEGENYLKESMLEPNAKLVAGFNGGMPSFQGQLNDEQIQALIAYIKTLK